VDTKSLVHPHIPPETPKTAKCAGCRGEYPRREMVTVHEGRHDGLYFFDGDNVCHPCARRNGVSC
jgi:hypothetical protein